MNFRPMTPLLALTLTLHTTGVSAQREQFSLNNNWQFRLSQDVERLTTRRVDLPHTWNAQDALVGRTDYKRGIGNYEKKLPVPLDWKGKRIFLRFEGANTITDVFVNGQHSGHHEGGYGAFVFEITDKVAYGQDNTLLVRVNNGETLEVMPLTGDFNHYGGLYRDVHVVVTSPICISPLDHGSPGVRLVQDSVSHEFASVRAIVDVTNAPDAARDAVLRLRLLDGDDEVLAEEAAVSLPQGGAATREIGFTLRDPHLWDGREDPFIYTVEVSLLVDGTAADVVRQPLGLRFFEIDPDKGFFLNGRHLQLKGVCRHQDRAEVGNALRREHHDEDAAFIADIGANAVRAAHYPQAERFYDLMDSLGIIVWAEIPFVGPGGYNDKGFINTTEFKENGRQQLLELIRQHGNHPSICMWGLFNELTMGGENPASYLRELNTLAHTEDPTRPTTAASNCGGEINFITDLMAWNRYDGWYGGMPAGLGEWLDATHAENPGLKIAISEYGAGASIYHQQDSLVKPAPVSWWHPENWQTHYHIENWRVISSRPFVWGSFIWNLFDFAAAHRHEGDRPGINDKGLVTFDRKVKKDAYYFYKANWDKSEPLLYLAERRCTTRSNAEQQFMAFTNLAEAELFVNGQSQGKAKADSLCVVRWENVQLKPGENTIEVKGKNGKNRLEDSYRCTLQAK